MNEPKLDIFVIEDNDGLREALTRVLASDGHRVTGLSSAEEVDDARAIAHPDLYLVDINLPGEDGLSLIGRIRAYHPGAGIIMLTARNRTSDRLQSYNQGADMHLTKPIDPDEIMAVVRALGKRLSASRAEAQGVLLRLDLVRTQLSGPAGQCSLTSTEARLLAALARAPSRTLENWQVSSQLGDGNDHLINKASLEVRLSRLRRKLQDVGSAQPSIKSIKGFGYTLCVPVVLE